LFSVLLSVLLSVSVSVSVLLSVLLSVSVSVLLSVLFLVLLLVLLSVSLLGLGLMSVRDLAEYLADLRLSLLLRSISGEMLNQQFQFLLTEIFFALL
jgi:hypothetical protein